MDPTVWGMPSWGLRTSPRWAQRCATVGGSCPEIPRRAGRHRHRAADEPRAGAAGRTGLAAVVAGLHVMGGAINHRGNTGPTSEWNIAVDPEAGHEVFEAWGRRPNGSCLGRCRPLRSSGWTRGIVGL